MSTTTIRNRETSTPTLSTNLALHFVSVSISLIALYFSVCLSRIFIGDHSATLGVEVSVEHRGEQPTTAYCVAVCVGLSKHPTVPAWPVSLASPRS